MLSTTNCGDQHPLHLNPPEKDHNGQRGPMCRFNYRAAAFIDPNASRGPICAHFRRCLCQYAGPKSAQHTRGQYLLQNSLWWIATAHIDAIRVDTYAYPDQKFMNELIHSPQRVSRFSLFRRDLGGAGTQIQGGWARNQSNFRKEQRAASGLGLSILFWLTGSWLKRSRAGQKAWAVFTSPWLETDVRAAPGDDHFCRQPRHGPHFWGGQ